VRDIGETARSLLRLSTFNGQNTRFGSFRLTV
jgi:hypothetical protein